MCILVRTIPSTDETEIDERCRHSRFLYELRLYTFYSERYLDTTPLVSYFKLPRSRGQNKLGPCVLFHSF